MDTLGRKFEQLWRGIRWAILGRRTTLDRPGKSSGFRRRAMIFSLAASIFVWAMLSLSENYYLPVEYTTCVAETEVVTPSCVLGLDNDSALTYPLPKTIRTTLYGPGISLLVQRFRANYWNSPITFDANVGELETPALLRIPADVSIESILPEEIDFQKEKKIERLVPITPRVTFLSRSPRFFVGTPRLNPDTVRISGPTSVVRQLGAWPTVPDTIIALRDTVYHRLHLSDSLAGLITLTRQTATITSFAPQYTEEYREQLRVEIDGIPYADSAVQLDPEFVTIRYQVPLLKVLEARQSQQIRAVVSYTQIYSDTTGRIEPKVEYPSDLFLRQISVFPDRLRYFVNIGPQ